jgi:hypothetical protein
MDTIAIGATANEGFDHAHSALRRSQVHRCARIVIPEVDLHACAAVIEKRVCVFEVALRRRKD